MKTKEEYRNDWWETAIKHKETLKEMLYTSGIDTGAMKYLGLDSENKPVWKTVEERFYALYKEQNDNLLWVFQGMWTALPDRPEIQSFPGFHVLCTLCSDGMFGGFLNLE